MTDDELTAIRQRAEAATNFIEEDYFDIECWHTTDEYNITGRRLDEIQAEADKKFLLNSRRDVLTLLAEVERLRTENASLRESLDLSDLIINSEAVK